MARTALEYSRSQLNTHISAHRESILSLLEMVRGDPKHQRLAEERPGIQHAIDRLEKIKDWLYYVGTGSANKPEGLRELEGLAGIDPKTRDLKDASKLASMLIQESQEHQTTLRSLFH